MNYNESLKLDEIDFGIKHEGEIKVYELLDNIDEKNLSKPDWNV
jgi:hypothetical protein